MTVDRAAPGAPTPPQEEQPNGAYAVNVPHELPYKESFENEIMRMVNGSVQTQDGVRIIPEGSHEAPIQGVSVKAEAISPQSLLPISDSELPLPLDDPRRVFASPISGVKLTHPGGFLEGGPGLDPNMDIFPDQFVLRHPEVVDAATLKVAVDRETEHHLADLKERMRARQKAIEYNDNIDSELQRMKDDHRMELQVHKKLADQKREKREAKERRKMDREGQTG